MPELPEVETVRIGLKEKTSNFLIKKIEVLKERTIASKGGSQEFIRMLEQVQIGDWIRRGKYLIANLENKKHKTIEHSGWLAIHLRMTGYFQYYEKETFPCPHTRVRFWNQKDEELRFVDIRNFGQMWWINPNDSPFEDIKGIKKLGPEPFSAEFNPSYLEKKLKGKTRSIKSALLDQTIIAGTGNIYADESLFAANILPSRECGKIEKYELEKLCQCIVRILKISIGKGGTTFSDFRDLNGINGKYGGQALVYRRNNKPCVNCGTKIIKKKISGRSSHWCPNCQI